MSLISKNLWAAQRAIVNGLGADSSEVRQLLDLWLLEAKQCRLMPNLSALYSVLPWEQHGHLGTGVTLLYLSHLFESREERRKCCSDPALSSSDDELLNLVNLGQRMLADEQLVEVPPRVKELMDRIVSSAYFNAEHSGSLVLDCLDDLIGSGDLKLQALRGELQKFYTPTPERTVFGYLDWEHFKLGALTAVGCGNWVAKARAIAKGTINVKERIEWLAGSWHPCLAAIKASRFVKDLLIARPPKSTMPHSHALMDCIEHTWLWMIESEIDVYSTVPNAKYSKLGNWHDEERMHRRFDRDVLPRVVEKTLRRFAIEAYLKGVPEADIHGSGDRAALEAMQGMDVVSYWEALKAEYIDREFDERLFPLDCTPWAARDPQDMDEYRKMNCWIWDPSLSGVYLHHELLQRGGVDDADLDLQGRQDSPGFFTNDPEICYDYIRDREVLTRMSPEEAMNKAGVRDIVMLPGRRHHWTPLRHRQLHS